MDLKTIGIILLIIAAMAAFSGCTGTTGPAQQTPVLTPDSITPVRTSTLVTAIPANEIAQIKVNTFGLDPSNGDIYEFLGTVQVNEGTYQSVQVILRYPDSQEYVYDAGGMGGSNQTIKPFFLYPSDHYMGTNPEKIIALDGNRYTTVYRPENGVPAAWIATPDTLISP
jgi:hypothetical protein